jgi:murein DD-endopeptidase MepM/ murein hydrolase activator NlpD
MQAEGNASAKAEFLDTTINFHPAPNNRLIALVPVDINTSPQKYSVLVTYGGGRQTLTVAVRSHDFKTIKLTLPEGKVTLSPENQKRAVKEATRLRSIWPQNTSKAWEGRFVIPTSTEISTVFGVRRIMNEKRTSVHRGIDLRGKTGAPVRAINSGRVILTDDLFFGGNTLIIDHGMGLYSVYMHLSKFNMSKGKNVSKDQVIGFVGSSGRATGPHLHMSVKLNGVSVNPESLFKLEL